MFINWFNLRIVDEKRFRPARGCGRADLHPSRLERELGNRKNIYPPNWED